MKTIKKAFIAAITDDRADEVMRLLDAEKAKVIPDILLTTPFYDGMNMLHISAAKGALETAGFLIGRGLDVNGRSAGNISALHIAASRNGLDMIGLLLKSGADITAQNDEGNTALHFATYQGNLSSVECLVNAGASLNVRNAKGQRPEDIANAKVDLKPVHAYLHGKRQAQDKARFNKRLDYIDRISRRKR